MGEDDNRNVSERNALARTETSGTGELKPLSRNLEPNVQAFVMEFRRLFGQLGLTLGQYAQLHHRDKSGLSRYLSGQRVPPRVIVDELLAELTRTRGVPLTAEVEDHVRQLHLRALEARDPRSYRRQILTDELENATIELRQAQRHVRDLGVELAAKESKIHDLTRQTRQLERAWSSERERTDQELHEAQLTSMHLQRERALLTREVLELQGRLARAQERAVKAEERCRILEQRLDGSPPTERGRRPTAHEQRGSATMHPRLRFAAELALAALVPAALGFVINTMTDYTDYLFYWAVVFVGSLAAAALLYKSISGRFTPGPRRVSAIAVAAIAVILGGTAAFDLSRPVSSSCQRVTAAQDGPRVDPRTNRTWKTLYECPKRDEAVIYQHAAIGSPIVGTLDAEHSIWVTCWRRGIGKDIISGPLVAVWYYTQGDASHTNRKLHAWGFIPATTLNTKERPDPAIPACPADMA